MDGNGNKKEDSPFGDVIFAYTRQDALNDGVLVDCSEMAREAGIKYPVALTRAAWDQYVRVPEGVDGQDENGRLWDILWMFKCGAMRARSNTMIFSLMVRNDNVALKEVELKAVIGPGDTWEPVITIMLPYED